MHGSPADADRTYDLVAAMNELQRHRGPDSSGGYLDRERRFAMAMQRLAIIDIAGGEQPMQTDDGRFVIVFNGEIVNSPQLRSELERSGESFSSDHSDTEVVLRAMARHGPAALPHLNGMFAFALYDSVEGVLFLARDRLGIKPLYYTESSGRFAFASEMKGLLTLPFIDRSVDRQSLFHYLSLMYVPGPASILSGISKLPPGHFLTYRLRNRAMEIRQWWKISFKPDDTVRQREWPDRIRDTLERAAVRWTLSDVPIACSLSGGLDSSTLVGMLANRGYRVTTYSLGFARKDELEWNELPLAAEVARMWGTEHHEVLMDPAALLSELGRMVWHLDEPYGGGLPSWAIFREMSRSVKVGLTGTGGDELFGNYGKWIGLDRGWLRRPAQTRENYTRLFFDRYYYFPDAEKRLVLTGNGSDLHSTAAMLFDRYVVAAGAPRDSCAVTDIETQLVDEFLAMTDRFSMAHSLEARPPFLDNELVDLVATIPARWRTNPKDLKGLLRAAVAPVLPRALLTAPKKGFVLPLRLWLREELRHLTERLLEPRRLREQGLFDPSVYDKHVWPYLEGRSEATTRVWGLLMFQLWHLQFIENASTDAPCDLEALVVR